mmetsp:Transcript_29748/g.98602  ORF Transcript_29748/g.98602 Transcript_29748/m.98602 type:complete len:137 (-) Transcript_29748:89-499(-)
MVSLCVEYLVDLLFDAVRITCPRSRKTTIANPIGANMGDAAHVNQFVQGGKHADLGTNHRLVAMVCRSFEEANGHFTVFCNTRKNPGVQCMFFDDGNDERTAKVWNWSDVPRYCGSEQFVPTLLLYEAINEHTPNL